MYRDKMLEMFFYTLIGSYLALSIFLLRASRNGYDKLPEKRLPSISIIIAAKNEAKNIKECMKSLNLLEYPKGKIEIFMSVDKSKDATEYIVRDFVKHKKQFRMIRPPKERGNLIGKANAIDCAVKKAKGDIILITDADCEVPKTWAKTIASYYTKNVNVVCGFTTMKSKGVFSGMQTNDFIFLETAASGFMNRGKPISCLGNNMSFRKKDYFKTGGYEKIPFSVTEDFSLLNSLSKLNKKMIYPCNPESLIKTKPLDSYHDLFRQKKRWLVGGLANDSNNIAVMLFTFLVHISLILSLFVSMETFLFVLFFKVFADFILVFSSSRRLKIHYSVFNFIAFELYFFMYTVTLPFFVLLNKEVNWKGRDF